MAMASGEGPRLEGIVWVDPSLTIGKAVQAIRDASVDFAVVGSFEHPVSVVRAAELEGYGDTGRTLDAVRGELPGLLIYDRMPEGPEEMFDAVSILARSGAPGMLVRGDPGMTGVVARDALAGLPLDTTLTGGLLNVERGETLTVPARTYVCRKCAPPKRRRPREGGAPSCDVFSHGPMEPES